MSVLLALLAIACPLIAQIAPLRLGDLDGDGQPSVLDLVRLINHINGTNRLSAAVQPYGDLNEDGFINQADVDFVADAILGAVLLPNPFAPPTLSAPVIATNSSTLFITGSARPNRRILVTGGRFTAFAVADSNGVFTVTVELRPNQLNNLFVTASSSNFVSGIPQPLRVIQDSQPPNLFIDFPTNGQTLFTSNSVIAGRVGDILSGFMGLDVWVHSSPSEGAPPPPGTQAPGVRASVNVGIGNNGTYERSNVPLVPGNNFITVTASDQFANISSRQITIQYSPLTNATRLEVVSGDLQATNVHRRLAQPIVVRALQAGGAPFANKLLTLEVTRSDGRLRPVDASAVANPSALTNDITRTAHGVMRLQLWTDANGEARAWWAMGGDAGQGNNRVCAMSAGIANAVYFCASAKPAVPTQINIGTGNNQKAEVGAFVSEPVRAWVNDSCNGIPGMPVTFTILQGAGKLFPSPGGEGQGEGGSNSITVTSSITGHAEALLQLGPNAGQNLIEATFPGNPALSATFIAYGVARDLSRPTTLNGLVLDNASRPIGGAACELSVNGALFTTATDAQGQYHFTNLPAGSAHLVVNGLTATNLNGQTVPVGSYPSLEYSLILIPNAENSLPTPVLLPRLNPNNARVFYGTNDLVLTCEGMAGLKMFVKAGSMRLRDGTLPTPQNPAIIALNQVHHDDVPMPMPDGASPPFAWTLQPGGATFDPPITIEYPNMSGLSAGTVAYFLSFNHDTGRFEIIASGHVLGDGSKIVTDPGAGLNLAGWGCNCPPYSATGVCEDCSESGAGAGLGLIITLPGCVECPTIRFQDANGSGLASPYKVGITANGHDRTQHLKAVVTPADAASDITIEAGPGLTLSGQALVGNIITFDLVGTAQSMAPGDTYIRATSGGVECARNTVSVIVPGAIGMPHPTFNGMVAGVNRALDNTTSPAIWDVINGVSVLLCTAYGTVLTVPVVDQFGDSLGDLYAGAAVSEDGRAINQNLTAASNYADFVGDCVPPVPGGSVFPVGDPVIAMFLNDPPFAMLPAVIPQNFVVRVDGFVLNPGVVNRTVELISPNTLKITWP